MIDDKTTKRLSRILALWSNGAMVQARAELYVLTRLQLAQLLVEPHQLDRWWALPDNKKVDFRMWVVRTFKGLV